MRKNSSITNDTKLNRKYFSNIHFLPRKSNAIEIILLTGKTNEGRLWLVCNQSNVTDIKHWLDNKL